ncbi:MAG: pseudaminic acid cytidylyltransferase [Telluria sp.]
MKAVAIIPARGGSKRIPRKNIRPFLGRPIISYVIEAGKQSGSFDEVMVSTDDEEIAGVARRCGAQVPFMRSARTADDQSVTLDVLREVIDCYRQIGRQFDILCCIYPTAALTQPRALSQGRQKLLADPGAACVLPIVRYSAPIQQALYEKDGRVHMFNPELVYARTQDLEPSYHDAGQWYWMRTSALDDPAFRILGSSSAPLMLNEMQVQDIDTEEDWVIAEAKYRLLRDD